MPDPDKERLALIEKYLDEAFRLRDEYAAAHKENSYPPFSPEDRQLIRETAKKLAGNNGYLALEKERAIATEAALDYQALIARKYEPEIDAMQIARNSYVKREDGRYHILRDFISLEAIPGTNRCNPEADNCAIDIPLSAEDSRSIESVTYYPLTFVSKKMPDAIETYCESQQLKFQDSSALHSIFDALDETDPLNKPYKSEIPAPLLPPLGPTRTNMSLFNEAPTSKEAAAFTALSSYFATQANGKFSPDQQAALMDVIQKKMRGSKGDSSAEDITETVEEALYPTLAIFEEVFIQDPALRSQLREVAKKSVDLSPQAAKQDDLILQQVQSILKAQLPSRGGRAPE